MKKIDKNSAGQNRTVQFFQTEQNKKQSELSLQALIKLPPPLSLSTQKEMGEVFKRLHSLSSSPS
jgi:hypothetical protein